MNKFFAVLAAALLATAAMGADEAGGVRVSADQKQSVELSHSLQELKFLEGHWNVEQHMKPSYSEKGQKAHGTFHIKPDLNGNALIGHFEADKASARDLTNFEGHLVIAAASGKHHGAKAHGEKAADAGQPARHEGAKRNFTLFWVDSEGNASLAHEVTFENNKLVATFDAHGKHPKSRVVFSKTADDKLSFTMEHQKGEAWEQVATATYTRGDKATDVKHESVQQR